MPGIINEILFYLLFGLVSGFVSGFLGIGGGFIRIPIFAAMFAYFGVEEKILMHVVVGTSIALIIPTAIASSFKQYRLGNLDLRYYRTWSLGILVGVVAGLLIVPYCSARTFRILFLSLVCCVIFYLSFFSNSKGLLQSPPGGWLKGFIAMLIGLASALTGTAGGAITTPVLKACSFPLKKAIAMSSATGLVVGVVGTAGYVYHGLAVVGRPHLSWGYVSLLVFFAMTPTIFFGASFGARMNNQCSDTTLRIAFIILLSVIAVNMFYKLLA